MTDVKKYQSLLERINSRLWELAELRFEETESVRILAAVLAEHGYTVESGVGGLPTAFSPPSAAARPIWPGPACSTALILP